MTAIPKNKPERDKKYLKAISGFGCVICFQDAIPHHLIGYGGSMGGKVSDYLTIPLCNKHHSATSEHGVHNDVDDWEHAHGYQTFLIKLTLEQAFDYEHISKENFDIAYSQCQNLETRFRG